MSDPREQRPDGLVWRSLWFMLLLLTAVPAAALPYDDAADPAYTDGWQTGDNGGTGFGPWTVLADGTNVFSFVDSSRYNGSRSAPTIDAGYQRSWGLWSSDNSDDAVAFRAFNSSLQPGDTVRLQMDNGYAAAGTGKLVGVNFRNGNLSGSVTNRTAGARLEFFFRGGMSTYSVVDAGGERNTGVGYTDAGLALAFTLGSNDAYQLAITREAQTSSVVVVTGFLKNATTPPLGQALDSVCLYALGTAWDYSGDLFFNRLSINQPYPLADTNSIVSWEQVHGALVENRRINAFYGGGLSEAQPALGDLDGDGDMDLIVGTQISQNPSLGRLLFFRNIGSPRSPRWERPEVITTISTNMTGEILDRPVLYRSYPAPALGDLDQDGDLDLLVGNDMGDLTWLENVGSAGYALWALRGTILTVPKFAAPSLADLDADGDLDLFVGITRPTLVVNEVKVEFFRNIGTPQSFNFAYQSTEIDFSLWFDLHQVSPCFGDMDGDGDFDLLLGRASHSDIQYRENIGSSTGQYWDAPQDNYQGRILSSSSPAVADVDGDGDLDLFHGGAEDIQFLENVGSPQAVSLRWSRAYSQFGVVADVGFSSTPALVDLDGDNDMDLVVGEANGGLNLFKNSGSPTTPTWTTPNQSYLGFEVATVTPVFADIDHDGDQDLFVAHWGETRDGTITFLPNIGSATNASWGTPVTNYAGVKLVSPITPTFGDLDGDGDLDLLVGNGTGTLTYVQNNGSALSPSWSAPSNYAGFIRFRFLIQPALSDLDLDGDLDLCLGEVGGLLTIYPNVGSATNAVWGIPGVSRLDHGNSTFLPLALGDLDGDGDPDLMAGQENGGLLHLRNGSPRLTINPVSASVAAEDSVQFAVSGFVGTVTWTLSQNRSGGGIHASSGLYTAGTNAPALDVVRAQGTNGLGGIAYVNVISPDQVASAGKAIIIAGGKSLSDPVWHATDYLANQAYRTLLYKGYSKATLQYLSFGPDQDVDGNTLLDDVDGAASLASVADAITNWSGNAQKLLLYLVDHGEQSGGQGYFRLNSGELLSSSQLAAWLNAWQSNHMAEVTVVMDFCYAGSFLDELALPAPPPATSRLDSAASTNYADGWQPGDAGGSGLESWVLRTNGASTGFFVWSSTNNGSKGSPHIDTNGVSWGMYASGNAYATAFRGFGGPLETNEDLTLAMDNGWIDNGQTVGVVFRNQNTNTGVANYNTGARLEFFFQGGSNAYFVVDSIGRRDTGIGFTDKGLLLRLTRRGGDAYSLSVTRQDGGSVTTITGFLGSASAPALSSLDSVALYNRNAGSGAPYDAYFNDLRIASTNLVSRRTVIAAAASNELTYFLAGGLVSFSGAFFSSLVQGAGVGQAFLLARDAVDNYQTAQLDDDGDGLYDRDADGAISSSNRVGASSVVGRDIPQIGTISPNQVLTNGTSASIFAGEVSSVYPLDRVWCSVIPPGHNPNTNAGIPVVDIPEVELLHNANSGRYENEVRGLSEPGTYALIFQARDIWGGVSLPKQSYLTQNGFDDRAVLVVGGPAGDPAWSNNLALADLAYQTLRTRLFDPDHIHLLAAVTNRDFDLDGSNDVDGAATADALAGGITNWAGPSQRLSLYLIGNGTNFTLRLNATQHLEAAALDAWLDAYQASNRAVNVILDFDGAGAFVTNLVAPAGRERIVVAGTRAWDPALRDKQGLVSFSQYFLSQIFGGQTIGESFNRAKKAIRRVSGAVRQRAELDDDGDGMANEKNADGTVAQARYLGTAFLTGDDIPNIGSVIPPTLLTVPDSLLVWAADVTDVDGISNVWCVVTPPTYAGTNGLLQTNLTFNASSNRYEALLTGLTNPGSYTLTFYAQDSLGELSQAIQSEILRADAYEVDDTPGEDTLYYGPAQFHNFHHTGDVDWVRFYAVSNYAYDISTFPLSTNCDTILSLYREETNGALTLLDSVDDFGSDDGELLGLDFPSNAFYAVRVTPYLTNDWQPGSYELDITIPAGGGPLIVYAYSRLHNVGAALPPGVVARVDATTRSFNGQLSVTFDGLPGGVNTVVVTNLPPGYRPAEATDAAGQVDNPDNLKYGNPRHVGVHADPNTLSLAYFTFIPTLQALGRARDLDTGAWVDGAAIEFTAPAFDNLVYTRYPNATYASPWLTGPDGSFPTNVLIPTTTYNLKLSKAGYSNLVQTGVISAPAAGSVHDLGERLLAPVDANGNAIADAWETLYFGGPTTATNDADDDGHSDLEEYWTGTNPTNASSVFESDQLAATNGFTLRWPVTPGRVYRVLSTPSLVTGHWSLAAGPWTAAVGQASMQWTDGSASTDLSYRIQVSTR